MNELNAAIYSRMATAGSLTTLLGAGTKSLFYLQAPANAIYPYVVWNIQGGGDENLSAHRVKNLVLFLRGYAVQASQAGSIDAQIDANFHLKPLTISGWSDLWLAREGDLDLVETQPSGQFIFMRGGLYRFMLEKT